MRIFEEGCGKVCGKCGKLCVKRSVFPAFSPKHAIFGMFSTAHPCGKPPGGGAKTRCLCGGIIAPDRFMLYYTIGICVRTVQASSWKCFGQAFSKACGFQRRSLGRPPQRANFFLGVSFLLAFFFAPPSCKEKSGQRVSVCSRKHT